MNQTHSPNPSSAQGRLRWLTWLINKLWLVFASSIIFVALLFVLARVLLPNTQWYQRELIDWFEQQFTVDIELQSLRANWDANGPTLIAENFVLRSNEQTVDQVSAKRVKIAVNLWKSILWQGFHTDQIVLEDTKINAYLGRQLSLRLDNPQQQENASPEFNATSQLIWDALFGQNNVLINRTQLSLSTIDGDEFTYYLEKLRVDNFGDVHRLEGELMDEQLVGHAQVIAELHGAPGSRGYFAKLYLQGKGIELEQLPFFTDQSVLAGGTLNWQVWADWRAGYWQKAVGTTSLNGLRWQQISAGDSFSLNWAWQAVNKDQGRLIIDNIRWLKDASEVISRLPEVTGLYKSHRDKLRWQFELKNWQLAEVFPLAVSLVDSDSPIADFLIKANLELELQALQLILERNNLQWQAPKIEGKFRALKYEPYLNWPQANQLAGNFQFADEQLSANLYLKQSLLVFPGLFREAIPVNKLSTSVQVHFNNDQIATLSIPAFHLDNDDLNLELKAQFINSGSAELNLYAEVQNADAAAKSRYLPTGIMSESLVKYLDVSIRSGRLPLAKALLRGPLSAFPFYKNGSTEGVFAILGQLENATFKYLPDWPTATDLSAELFFAGNGMDIKAKNANALGNKVRFARALIEDFSQPGTPFDLFLDIESKDNDALQFLQQTPLEELADNLHILNYSGPLKTRLELHLPLDDAEQINLAGEVEPGTGNLLKIAQLELTDIQGKIRFNEDGIDDSKVSGKLFDRPFSAAIKGRTKESSLSLDIDGEISPSLLRPFVGNFWADRFTGTSHFDALVDIGSTRSKGANIVRIQSDLKGMAIQLPDELNKSASETRDLFLTLTLADKTSSALINFGALKGSWQWQSNADDFILTASEFRWKSERPIPSRLRKGINADITLKKAVFDDWWQLYQQASKYYQERMQATAASHNIKVGEIKLNVAEIENPLMVMANQSLTLGNDENGEWQFSIESADFKGRLQIPNKGPWLAQFERAKVKLLTPVNTNESGKTIEFLGDKLPPLIFSCGSCAWGNKSLGSMLINIRPTTHALNLSGRLFQSKSHDLWFNGRWSDRPSGQLSRLSFSGNADDFSQLLARFDYPVAVKESNAIISGRIRWPGAPWQISLSNMEGAAIGELGKGYLSEVSDSGARIFSLFNLQSLTRKLQLDFKDVYKKGFFFEKMTGTMILKDGVFSTHDTFIDGSAAKVYLDGVIDLKAQQIRQYATVIPNLTSSLPVLAAWAVEPTTGVIVYILNKLMEPAIDVVTRIDYRIEGPLDQPKVEQIRRARKKVKVKLDDKRNNQQPEEQSRKNKGADDG